MNIKEACSKSKNEGKKFLSNFLIFVLFFLITFIFLLKSPLHIWGGYDSTTDSSVFKTIALMMNKGFMPYLDSFDHKGPLLYVLNYVGLYISYYRGIWFIEFINLFFTLCIFYKIARFKCNKLYSVVTVLLAVSVLFDFFEGGNFVEEYSLPFIAGSLYIFLDYLLNNKINKKRLVTCGLCLGAVLLLRPNMIAVWIVFCIAIFIKCLKEKKYSDLRNFIIFFLIGMMTIIIPFMIWLGVKGALLSFWNEYIVFNKEYSVNISKQQQIKDDWIVFVYFFKDPILILSSIILIYLFVIKKKSIYLINLLYIFITLVLVCLSRMIYLHYGMILVPAVIFPFAALYEFLKDKENNYLNLSKIIITISLATIIILPKWILLFGALPEVYSNKDKYNISDNVKAIADIVISKTKEDEPISVYGNWNIIYVVTKRIHATKYSYQFPIGQVTPGIMEDYFKQLKEERVKIIVVQKFKYDNQIEKFLKENNYSLIWQENDELNRSALVFQLEDDNHI